MVPERLKPRMRTIWRTPRRLTWLWMVSVGGLLLAGLLPMSHAAERDGTPPPASPTEKSQTNQEVFLQHFISRSLVPETSTQSVSTASSDTPQAVSPQPSQASAPAPSFDTLEQPTRELTMAATKMVLSLAAMLILLIGGAYLVRRYVLRQTSAGKRGKLLRVVAKAPLTPKTSVALVEVPGKVIVVGVTGTALSALGEITSEAMLQHEQAAEATASFAAALDQHTRTLEEQEGTDNDVLHVPEAIQKKVRGLKRL